MIDDSVLNETIVILNSYIEADALAEGYGGGSDNPYFKPAKQLLRKLKKVRKLRQAAAKKE